MDRPAAWSGIKELKFTLLEWDLPLVEEDGLALLEKIALVLRLEKLEIRVSMCGYDIGDFLGKGEKPAWAAWAPRAIRAFRSMTVTRCFEIHLFVLCFGDDDGEGDGEANGEEDEEEDEEEALEALQERLRKEFKPLMEDLFRPDSLRPKALGDMTAVEKYTATRV